MLKSQKAVSLQQNMHSVLKYQRIQMQLQRILHLHP